MNLPWFKRNGFFFKPVSVIGWLILVMAVLFSLYVFISIDSHSHSVSDTLRNFIFNLLIIVAGYYLVAAFSSRK